MWSDKISFFIRHNSYIHLCVSNLFVVFKNISRERFNYCRIRTQSRVNRSQTNDISWCNQCKSVVFVYLTIVIFHTYNGNRMMAEWPFGMEGFSFNLHKYCYNWFTALLFRFLFTRLGILTLAGDLWWNGKQNLYFAVGLFFFFFFNAV